MRERERRKECVRNGFKKMIKRDGNSRLFSRGGREGSTGHVSTVALFSLLVESMAHKYLID